MVAQSNGKWLNANGQIAIHTATVMGAP